MKVVQFVNTLAISDGGPARHAYELNIALNQFEHVICDMWVLRGRTAAKEVGTRTPLMRDMAWSRLVRSIASADRVIVHGYYLVWVPAVVMIARIFGVAVYLMPHGALNRYELAKSRPRKILWRAVVGWLVDRLVTRFVTATSIEAAQVGNGVRAVSAPVGVGTLCAPSNEGRHVESAPRHILGTLSRIAPKKRIDIAIETTAILRSRGWDAELRVAGTFADRLLEAQLRRLVAARQIEEYVHFVGEVSGHAKTQYLAEIGLLLMPSDDENFGIALAEAVCSGVPVVASTGVAALEFCASLEAVAEAPVDAREFASAVEKFWTDDQRLNEITSNAIIIGREVFDWSAVARRWLVAMDLRSQAE